MAIETVKDGDALIAKAEGRVDGSNARAFQEDLDAVCGEADQVVILDLEQLSYISSAGLRVILMTAKGLEGRNVKFAICSLSEAIKEVFQISGFDKIIPVKESSDEGIKALRG